MTGHDRLDYRRATDADLPGILALCEVALGWPADPRNEQLFRWKHLSNPFGGSPMWVATADQRIVGFRAMMPWRFRTARGETLRAVRAVDTATHPDFQRRGIFSALNALAIEALTKDGVDFIFNTPNAESLPGYLKQGWHDLGRVAIVARPAGLKGALAMPSALGKATKWSEPLPAGADPTTVSVQRSAWSGVVTTDATAGFFTWRYAGGPVAYRAFTEAGSGIVVRLRGRGSARELVLASSWGTEVVVAKLIKEALAASHASYAVSTAGQPGHSAMLPLPNLGPHLTVRRLASEPPRMEELGLHLGDVELF